MGDLMETANAIWKTLDSLSEKNPEEYARFIQQQLEEGAELFGNKKKGSTPTGKSESHGSKEAGKVKCGDGEGDLKRSGKSSKGPATACGKKEDASLLDKDIGSMFNSLRIQDQVGKEEDESEPVELVIPNSNQKKTSKKLIQELD